MYDPVVNISLKRPAIEMTFSVYRFYRQSILSGSRHEAKEGECIILLQFDLRCFCGEPALLDINRNLPYTTWLTTTLSTKT